MKCVSIKLWDLLGCFHYILNAPRRNRRPFGLLSSCTVARARFWFVCIGHYSNVHVHTGQCKRTGGCYEELVVAFFSTGGRWKKSISVDFMIYLKTCIYFYLWWNLSHRPPVTLQFMALPSNWWFNSWFGLQSQQSSGVLPWQVFFF